jgi:protein SCO1/2
MRTRTAFYVGLSLLVGACGGSAPAGKEYTLQGQILSVSADHKEANIKHEEIVGFMSAMTMPYHVRDAKEFEPLAPGDLINATLVVAENDAYLTHVKKVGDAPLERPAGTTAMPNGVELLKSGQPVPNVALVDQEGKAFGLDAFRGSAIVLTFSYTTCPLPTFCPLMDKHFAAIQAKLQEERNALKVHLLTVTIDPAVDTPPVLRAHAKTLGADPKLWTLATGDAAALDTWAARFGVSVSRATNDPRDITHNLRTMILDREGNLVQTYSGNEWTPAQALAAVRVMVGID